MKKNYKNKAMRSAPVNRDLPKKAGIPENKIKIYLSKLQKDEAEKIADKMQISLDDLIQRYISQMLADRRWPE